MVVSIRAKRIPDVRLVVVRTRGMWHVLPPLSQSQRLHTPQSCARLSMGTASSRMPYRILDCASNGSNWAFGLVPGKSCAKKSAELCSKDQNKDEEYYEDEYEQGDTAARH